MLRIVRKRNLSGRIIGFCLLTMISVDVLAQSPDNLPLNEHLKPFAPYIGKTWRGTSTDSTNAIHDVSRWERALNGQAIRILHSVNEGEYGGETIITWDSEKESLIFYYFTTAGFYTHGTITIDGDQFISHEIVTGNQNGITEVKGIGKILPDGRLSSSSQYFQNGAWVDGHAFIYQEYPDAEVVFQ